MSARLSNPKAIIYRYHIFLTPAHTCLWFLFHGYGPTHRMQFPGTISDSDHDDELFVLVQGIFVNQSL